MKKSIRLRARVFVSALSALSLASLTALAQSQYSSDPEVVVTTNRREVTADQVFQSVSVITRQQIEESGAQSIMDLLAGLPGVQTARSGGAGKATSVYMRGTTTNQLLVLVNGVRVSAAGTGEFDWNSFLPEQIEKIEVVRGPLASLYGSDAVGGVIQIFTRTPQSGVSIAQTIGSYGTRQTDVSIGGGGEWVYGLRMGTKSVDGMQTILTKPNRFGSRQKYIDGTLNRKLDRDTRLQFGLSYGEGNNEDEYGLNFFRNYSGFARVDHATTDSWHQTLQLSSFGVNLTVPKGYPPGEFSTDRTALSWQNLFTMSSGVLTLGADTWVDKVVKLDYWNVANNVHKEFVTNAIFGQYATKWQDVDWQLGGRSDHHNVYGNQSTFNAAAGKKINSKLQVMSSYGTAFKAPSANDLYWPHSAEPNTDDFGNPLSSSAGTCGPTVMTSLGSRTPCVYDTVGNASLRPEKSKTAEIGMRYVDGYALSLNYFDTKISDLISWKSTEQGVGDAYGSYYQPVNVNQVTIRGLETGVRQRIADWFVAAQYTRLLAINQETGLQLDRRPKSSAALTLSKEIKSHKVSAMLQLASERLDSSGQNTLAGYGVLNVSDLYKIDANWSLLARVDNVLDKKYTLATSFGTPYATPGRSGYLTLRYSYK
jgi:vitamin B12 transporter